MRELHLDVLSYFLCESIVQGTFPCKIVAFQISFNFTLFNSSVERSFDTRYRNERINLNDFLKLRCLS